MENKDNQKEWFDFLEEYEWWEPSFCNKPLKEIL
jgi:hypothetical protein